ncbi:MAG: hypothetical protein M3326_01140, partial [Actinomycetota bacterium]|nr:hypothetical protein [Actinomycetota bacterium]
MSIIHARTDQPVATTWPPSGEPVSGRPIASIVAGSVATGLIGALFLTLVVFAGATEHVITG